MTMQEKQEANKIDAINLKTLLTLLGVMSVFATTVGAYFVQSYRVAEIEKDLARTESKVTGNTKLLSEPRYTLEQDIRRMAEAAKASAKELDRRQQWMTGQDEFRLSTIRTNAETSSNIREIKVILLNMKKDIDDIKSNNH